VCGAVVLRRGRVGVSEARMGPSRYLLTFRDCLGQSFAVDRWQTTVEMRPTNLLPEFCHLSIVLREV
jgi:hypothetical protein